MNRTGRYLLVARMALTLSLIAAVSVAFLGIIVGVVWLVARLFAALFSRAPPLFLAIFALVFGLPILTWLYRTERGQGERIVDRAASETTPAEELSPELVASVERLAQQADLPVPTVLVSHTDTPEAYATGLRQSSARLVLSEGLLSSLSRREVRAVVAHELAHVNNRDAAVMTLAAFPTLLADAILDRSLEGTGHSDGKVNFVATTASVVAGVFYAVGRALLSTLSRYRELVADDAAVATTGDPAALASALRTLDEAAARTPDEDLRERAGVSAFSIVPLDPEPYPEDPDVKLGPDGERDPYMYRKTAPIRPLVNRVFSTHPSTDARIDRLRERQANLERE